MAILTDALRDSLNLVPFLLIIYIGIAWLEERYGATIQHRIQRAGKAGPLLGALFGCLPQCGFSVIGSALYARRLISTGSLLAVFISTSDEAVPVILANPARIGLVMPLILTKVILALIAGFTVDAVTRRRIMSPAREAVVVQCAGHAHHDGHDQAHGTAEVVDSPVEVDGCCGHHLPERNRLRTLLWHPLWHTTQVFLVLFIVSIGINYLVGEEGAHLGKLLGHGTIWQPMVASLIGLIPSCGASVAITELFLQGGLSYGAMIAGLSSSVGLGLLVLIKENRNAADTARVLALLVAISVAAGLALQALMPYLPLPSLR